MLKYLDVARLVGAGIKCPSCNGMRCRPSRWHSKHERSGCKGFQPYRCEDCANRFLATNGAALERTLVNVAASVILGIALLTVGEILLENAEPEAKQMARASTDEEAEESQAGSQVVIQVGQQPADKAPETQAPEPAQPDAKVRPETPPENKVDSLRKAAEAGQAPAMVELARLLMAGEKIPKDVGKAAKWMQLAASTGNPEGMFELGRYYRDGSGMAPNPVRAYLWLNRAAAARHVDAAHERDALVRTMSEEKLKEAHELSRTLESDGVISNSR